MNEPLDLDAIEARYRNRILIISDGDNQPVIERIVSLHKDLAALIAEVRRLRAMLEIAADEYDDFVRSEFNRGPGATKLIKHWSEKIVGQQYPCGMVFLNIDEETCGINVNNFGYTGFNGEQLSPEAIEQIKSQLKEKYGY